MGTFSPQCTDTDCRRRTRQRADEAPRSLALDFPVLLFVSSIILFSQGPSLLYVTAQPSPLTSENLTQLLSPAAPSFFAPIRIAFEPRLIRNLSLDWISPPGQSTVHVPRACASTGQTVSPQGCDGTAFCRSSCAASDVATPAKVAMVTTYLQVAAAALEKMLTVNRNASSGSQAIPFCPLDTTETVVYAAADFVLFVTMRPSPPAQALVFIPCTYSSLDRRPTSAMLNVPPAAMDGISSVSFHSALMAKLCGALGFSYDAARWYVASYTTTVGGAGERVNVTTYRETDPVRYPYGPLQVAAGSARTPAEVLGTPPFSADGVAQFRIPDPNPIDANTRIGFITPRIRQVASWFFGCPFARTAMVLLEEQDASVFMSWEQRVLFGELMTHPLAPSPWRAVSPYATASNSTIYHAATVLLRNGAFLSPFTLALFADMGYYGVSNAILSTLLSDWAEAAQIGWPVLSFGWQRGCSALTFEPTCSYATWTNGYFCTGGVTAITADGTGYGRCLLVEQPTVSDSYYYHLPNQPGMLGFDSFADYCPYVGLLSDQLGTVEGRTGGILARCSVDANGNSPGGAVGLRSNLTGRSTRAVRSTIVLQSVLLPDRSLNNDTTPQCMEVLCLSTERLMVRVGDAWFPCDKGDDSFELTYPPSVDPATVPAPRTPNPITSYTYYGQVLCPEPRVVCSEQLSLVTTDTLYRPRSAVTATTITAGAIVGKSDWPILVSVSPTVASVGGGAVITVLGYNLKTSFFSCRALRIGGVPSNLDSYQFVGNATMDIFLVNTTELNPSSLAGGPEEDGSGVVDVELMCSGVLSCGSTSTEENEQLQSMCAVARLPSAFTYLPLPLPPEPSYFLESVTNQIIATIIAVFVIGLVIFLIRWYLKQSYAAPTQEELDMMKVHLNADGSSSSPPSRRMSERQVEEMEEREMERIRRRDERDANAVRLVCIPGHPDDLMGEGIVVLEYDHKGDRDSAIEL